MLKLNNFSNKIFLLNRSQNNRSNKKNNGNVPPGTVVDSIITNQLSPTDQKMQKDFYLCSHKGILVIFFFF